MTLFLSSVSLKSKHRNKPVSRKPPATLHTQQKRSSSLFHYTGIGTLLQEKKTKIAVVNA